MTKFYEIRKRDGAARIGQLQLNDVTQTPLMLTVEHAEELKEITVEDSKDLASDKTCSAPRGAVLLPEVHPLFTKNEAPQCLPTSSCSHLHLRCSTAHGISGVELLMRGTPKGYKNKIGRILHYQRDKGH